MKVKVFDFSYYMMADCRDTSSDLAIEVKDAIEYAIDQKTRGFKVEVHTSDNHIVVVSLNGDKPHPA